ncbi:MAG: DUF1127 domain-containing protein [Marinovum sp.]|nr:DUF1127 domain-containing protein [Marinovum sp.]
MAHFVDELNNHPTIMARLGQFLVNMSAGSARCHEMERLAAMTDEQLSSRGLKREDIAKHVFRDVLYV